MRTAQGICEDFLRRALSGGRASQDSFTTLAASLVCNCRLLFAGKAGTETDCFVVEAASRIKLSTFHFKYNLIGASA